MRKMMMVRRRKMAMWRATVAVARASGCGAGG
jgi:hypothetical protein